VESRLMDDRTILLAAGGTGGHLFPAQALAAALQRRGVVVDLATDERATRYGDDFPARATHVIPSATIRGRDPISLIRTASALALGAAKSLWLLRRIRPAAVVGFGGYPTLPPLFAATLWRIPTVIHDANAVMGRANRMLSSRVTAIATSFPGMALDVPLAAKATVTGNPIRPMVIAAAGKPYAAPSAAGPLHLLVTGGSQGARVMADVVPPAIETMPPDLRAWLVVTQQARGEDETRVRESYARIGAKAEVAPFFSDLPARIAASHLIVSRAGASTVAELAAIGRPSILVPLPHALDQDQAANAAVLEAAGGAIRIMQPEFTPQRLADEIVALSGDPEQLAKMAAAAKSAGTLDGAERLAEVVMEVAGNP
jgi:UDP-N-acetylglucosamine--N-acetylmuramyl-(pentapeptide) pyrophosphoryl-undecaprenol N-acetylglucosamine transferase